MQVACNIRGAIHQELGLTMSFGIAVGKLAARLAGPLHKPSGMTVVPPHKAAAFLLDTPILKVPHLRYVCLLLRWHLLMVVTTTGVLQLFCGACCMSRLLSCLLTLRVQRYVSSSEQP